MMMMICYENGRIVRKNSMRTVEETVVATAAADGGVYLIFFFSSHFEELQTRIAKEIERERERCSRSISDGNEW